MMYRCSRKDDIQDSMLPCVLSWRELGPLTFPFSVRQPYIDRISFFGNKNGHRQFELEETSQVTRCAGENRAMKK